MTTAIPRLQTDRSGNLRIIGPTWSAGELNSLSGSVALPAEIEQLINRHTSTFFSWRAACEEAAVAKRNARGAAGRDDAARVAAIANGTKPPAPAAGKTAQQADEAAQRARDYGQAAVQIEENIKAAVARHAPTWDVDLAAEQERCAAQVRQALDVVTEHINRWAQVAAVRRVVAAPYDRKVWPSSAVSVLPEGMDNALAVLLSGVGEAHHVPFYADGSEHVVDIAIGA